RGGRGRWPPGDAPLCPQGGQRPLLRPGSGPGGGRLGQPPGGVSHQKR
ncbi:hypothetical protein PKCEKB_PKCEKB_17335, partial [Dysosmobacter welbionis]